MPAARINIDYVDGNEELISVDNWNLFEGTFFYSKKGHQIFIPWHVIKKVDVQNI